MRWRSSLRLAAAEGGEVPAYYAMQIQHQLMVSGAGHAHLWVFDGQRGLLHVVEPDAGAAESIREAWDAFAVFLETDTPPPLSDADARQRDDESWHLERYRGKAREEVRVTVGG